MRFAVIVLGFVLLSCGSNPDPDGRGTVITIGTTTPAALTALDTAVPPDKMAPYTSDHFTVSLSAGQQVTLEMCRCAQDLDPYLELAFNGTVVAQDDDSAGNRSAVITYTAPSSGTYDLFARDCCREPIPDDGQPRHYVLRAVGGLQTLLQCPSADSPDPNCP